MDSLKKLEEAEKRKIYEKLSKTEPGTKEYRELQAQLGAFEIMDEKRKSGSIKPVDVFKFTGTLVTTGLVITADQWFPLVGQKLKLGEFAQKLFK